MRKKNEVWITDIEAVTALAGDLGGTWERLMAGETAIRPVSRFSTSGYPSDVAACIDGLESFGRRSMTDALVERVLAGMGPVSSDTILYTSTTKAGVDNLEMICRKSKADQADTLLESLPDLVSAKLGLADRGVNISAACASSTIAVARGAFDIAAGLADAVLICCADLVTEFVFSGFCCLKALSSAPCRPFDRDRDGMSLGEGAAAVLLMSGERAQKEGRHRLGTIAGWGIANDATHITAPARDGCGLVLAVRRALTCAELEQKDITAINAHGTGTVFNDMMEITAFRALFGDRRVPANSVKGAIGHALGAAGGIEVGLGLKMLSNQTVTPTPGLAHPAEGAERFFNVGPAEFSGDFLLTTNSGFGGVNAALILGKGDVP